MLRPLGGGNMNPTGGLSSIGMNMNMNNPNNNLGSGGAMVGMSGMSSGGVGGGGMAMPMSNLPMSGVTNVNSGVSGGMGSMTSRLVSPRHAVHIIWDIEHVGVPSGASEVWVINSLVALAERECQGYVESFVACCHEGYLDLKTKRELQDSGVAIEEVHSRRPTDNYILTRLLALSLQLSLHRNASSPNNAMPSLLQLAGTSSSYNNTSAAARPILIMITGERDLARALHIIRQSSIFQEIVLLHPPMHDSGEVLRQAATQAVEWLSFLSLNQMALQQQQQQSQPGSGGRLTPMSNMMAPTPPLSLPSSSSIPMTTNTPPGIATRSRPPGGPGSSTNTPETRYRGMSGDQSSSQSPALTPSSGGTSGSGGVDETRPMGGRGDWHAWQDKTDKLRVQQQSAGGGTPTTTNRKSESDNWRTPATPTSTTSSGNNHDLPPPPYRTPYQREMARRLHPSSTSTTPSTGSPGSSPLASPPSPGDVRVSDERDRERERDRDHYYDQQHRVTTAADYLREKEAAAWEQGSSGGGNTGGGRSRSSSTASVSGRLISLDEQHSQHSGTSSGGHSTPTSGSSSGSGTPTGQGQGASYAQVLGKTGGGTGSSMTTTTTITPRTSGSASAPSTPQAGSRTPGGTITANAGSSTPGASARGRPDRATLAVRLFGHVMNVCAEEKIIPRESVIRSKLEDTSVWDSTKKDQQQAPPGLKSWQSLHMEFEAWLDLVQQKKACVCVGVSPQRVLWPCPPQARFECADYFRPQERLNAGEMTQLVEFLANDQHRSGDHASQHHQGGGQVDRGRYGFANYLKSCGPPFVRDMPRGYVVELVQLLLNKNFLQFRKGKVSFRSTAAGRWKRALESVQASGIGGTPSLDNDDNTNDDESSNPALMDQHHALMSSTATATPSSSLSSQSSSSNKSGSGIGSNNESVLITSTRPGAKGSSTSLLTTSGSIGAASSVGGKPGGSTSPYPPARAPSSSPDSSSESSSQALRRANILAQRNTNVSSGSSSSSSGNIETRPRAATLPSDSKSGGGKLIARGTTPPLTGAAPVGPSLDFDDPVELLAVKCVEAPSPILSSSTMALILKREHLASDGARQAFFPLYHFEKSGEQHAPLWVCVITLDLRYPIGRTPVGTLATSSLVAPSISQFPPISNNGIPAVAQRPKRFRSTRKAKKLEAQQEAAMRAIESGYWTEAFQPPVAEGSKPVYPPVVDYVANIIDDPVVILDRLLITLEQAPAVYSMESAITQHGSGSRTMWTCGVQLALRPRPAHLTTGTISMEQAENGEMPSTTSDDVPSVRYPTIKFQASQAKKFDAKGQVASHVLGVLEKSRHRYPMLFQATPEPLPPRPKTLLMPSMIGTNSTSGSGNTSGSIASGIPQASAPSPPPPQPSSIIVSQGPPPKPPSPVVLPQRTARERSNAVSHGGSQSNSGSSGASSSGSDNASAVATYHAAQARAHKLLLEQQAQQQHQHQQMLQQQQAQQYGGMGAMAPVVPVITMMPHPPPMPPSYVPIPISSPPSLPSYGVNNNNNNNNNNASGSASGRSQALRATANEWQPASSSTTGSSGNVISSAGSDSPPSSSSLPSSTSTQSASSSTSSTMMPSPPSSSPPRTSASGSPSSSGGTFGDRLQRIPMIRTFLSNLTSPSSSAPSGGRYLTPSHVVASENSGVPPPSSSSSSSSVPSSSTTNQSSNAPPSSSSSSPSSSSSVSGGQVPGAINVNVPNKSPSGSPLSGIRAITPPGQNLRAYVSPMGRTRPVSESALGLGGIQWEHQSPSPSQQSQQSQHQPQSLSQSPIPIGGTGKDNSSGTSSGSNSARMAPRRLAEHDHDDNMRALRRSVDDLLRDQPSSGGSKASNNNNDSSSDNNNNNKNVNDGNKNTNSSNDNMKPISNNNAAANTNNSNDRINIKADKSDNTSSSGMMKTNTNINTNTNDNNDNSMMMKNNKNESRALKIPSPVSSEPMITSPLSSSSAASSSSSSMSTKESACPLPGASQDQHDQHACHAM